MSDLTFVNDQTTNPYVANVPGNGVSDITVTNCRDEVSLLEISATLQVDKTSALRDSRWYRVYETEDSYHVFANHELASN